MATSDDDHDAARRTEPVRWGVLGATSFVYRVAVQPALRDSDTARVIATASRSGPDHDSVAARRYGDYAAVLSDPDVEAVYLPLPNDQHEPWTLAAAVAGKHILCEKPLAPDAPAARRMVDACAAAGVHLFEAYMTPFHPRSALWDGLVANGRLGVPRYGTARFTYPHRDPGDHRWRPDGGGGALLDVGIYCIEPLLAAGGWRPGDVLPQMAARTVTSDSGVDATFAGWLSLPTGFAASFCCSFDAPESQVLEIVGRDGALRVEPAFTPAWDDRSIVATARDGTVEIVRSDPGAMYRLMVEHVARVIRGHEPPRRPPAAAIALAEVLDGLRAVADGST